MSIYLTNLTIVGTFENIQERQAGEPFQHLLVFSTCFGYEHPGFPKMSHFEHFVRPYRGTHKLIKTEVKKYGFSTPTKISTNSKS